MNDKRVSHGMYGTRIYRIWAAMKRRCQNKHYHEYHLYGGRGINVCSEWQMFESFYEWSKENGYDDTLTLDRVDNNEDYKPSNCKWVSSKEQANNRRSNILITYNEKERTLKEWCELLSLNYKTVWKRVKSGWPIEEAFNKPLKGSDTDGVQTP